MALPPELRSELDVLMIDNFDSFTWNLYQSLCLLGAKVTVIRNDAITTSSIPLLNIKHLIVSPGPGHPKTDSGISRAAIRHFSGRVPVLGVCMGLECVVDDFGGEIAYAGEIMHGKMSRIRHDNRGCFKSVPQGIQSTRYHSLSASIKTLPAELQISAVTEDSGVIMGVRHREHTVEAVQYHPESILSEGGDELLRNFLALRGGSWKENPDFNVLDPSNSSLTNGHLSPSSEVPTILEKIYAQRARDVELAKSTPGTTPEDMATLLSLHLAPPLISLVTRLRNRPPALMAEIKRASPSKGPIAMSTNAAHQALTYALAGASVISVLTEPTWFKGSLLDMRLAREAISNLPNRPAVLRKDFILDEYQIAEARLNGADTVLLIVAMLSEERLKALYTYSLSLGMEPLVEVNNAQEMETALGLGAKVIGVNNRNLHDFNVDMGTTSRLADMVQGRDVTLCALSGITGAEDVRLYVSQGVSAVLVGEALMRAADAQAFIRKLLDFPEVQTSDKPPPLVKICGIRTEQEAFDAIDAGADMLGLMFVPSSKRFIPLDNAKKISAAVHAMRFARQSTTGPDDDTLDNEPWFSLHARRLARTLSTSSSSPLLVGVFQGQSLSTILHAVATVKLDLVQLHGNEPLDWCKHIPVPTIRVFHVGQDGQGMEGITRPGLHQFVLLDSVREASGLSGGSGKVVDWDSAKSVVELGELTFGAAGGSMPVPKNAVLSSNGVEAHAKKHSLPVILAGGLTPENVGEAVDTVGPWAVDVSGGVETEDGHGKDKEKVRKFVAAAKGF